MQLRIEPRPGHDHLTGFRYLWLKSVTAFDDRVHCARCLIGEYVKGIDTRAKRGTVVDVDNARAGDLFYLCGVSAPYDWKHNAHLALRVDPEALTQLELWNGARLTVVGARRVSFDHRAAHTHYGNRGRAFLTCRNFQFGAALKHGALTE